MAEFNYLNLPGIHQSAQRAQANQFNMERAQVGAERQDKAYDDAQELDNARYLYGATKVLMDIYEKDPDQFYVAADELGTEGIQRGAIDADKWDPQLVTIEKVQEINNAARVGLAGRKPNADGGDTSRINNYEFYSQLDPDQQRQFQNANAASKALKTVDIAMSDGRKLTVNYDPQSGSGYLLDGSPVIVAPGQGGGVRVMGQQGDMGEGQIAGMGQQPQVGQATLGISEDPASQKSRIKEAELTTQRDFDSLKVTEQNLTMMENAFRLEPMMQAAAEGANAWNTGWGSMLSVIPGGSAKDLDATITTVKANIGFDRLQRMRAESPTGGALGQVAVQELVALQSTIANLDTAQSTEQFKANMQIALSQYQSWRRKWGEAIMREGTRDQQMRYYEMVPEGGRYMHPDGSWRTKGAR